MSDNQRSISVSKTLGDRMEAVCKAQNISMAQILEKACESVPAPKIERDNLGNHRIVIGDRKSLWVGPRQIAVLGSYRACTEFFKDVLPHNVVFRVIPMPAEDSDAATRVDH